VDNTDWIFLKDKKPNYNQLIVAVGLLVTKGDVLENYTGMGLWDNYSVVINIMDITAYIIDVDKWIEVPKFVTLNNSNNNNLLRIK
jgi:hypothetical protein